MAIDSDDAPATTDYETALAQLQERFEAERLARLAAESRLGAAQVALAELEARLGELEDALQRQLESKSLELAEAREAADRAGRTKTAFLANMSHEIRTPVSAVMGYANLIAATEQASAETRDWSRRLQRSAEHLLALLDDVLDLSKIDAGRLDLHLVPTEPTTVLEEVGVLMEPRAVERGLDLIVVCDTDLPAKIRTDPLRLRQILVNLVGNAIKYTQRGQIAVHAKARPLGQGDEQELVLEVSDTGIGIAQADLERLFLPFEQVNRGTRTGGGVGLGLDIARRLARKLGGDISVTSKPGVGSIFTLTLPVEHGLGRTTTPARVVTRSGVLRPDELETARLDGRTVLLVDDTDDNRRIVAHFLRRGGAVVIEAASLERAYACIAASPDIGLVLTDLQLPDGHGLDLVRELRARGDRRSVVALTADAMLETRAHALDAGVDDFIVKPVIGNRLVARIAALFLGGDSPRAAVATVPARAPEASPDVPTQQVELGAQEDPGGGRQSDPWPMPVRQKTTPLAGVSMPRPAASGAVRVSELAPGSRPPGLGQRAEQASAPEVPEELLHRFYAVLAERVYATEDAIRAKERVRLRDLAHRIAGSGSTMGHPELTELGRLLEKALNEGTSWEQVEPVALRFLTASREAATRRPWM